MGSLWPAARTDVDIDRARGVQRDNGARLWVASNDSGGICVLAQIAKLRMVGPASECGGSETMRAGTLIVLNGAPDTPVGSDQGPTIGITVPIIAGAVPDGVTDVTLSYSDGSSQAVRVHDNLFFAEPKELPSTVEFTDSTGTTRNVGAVR